jgi:hypothetical protein
MRPAGNGAGGPGRCCVLNVAVMDKAGGQMYSAANTARCLTLGTKTPRNLWVATYSLSLRSQVYRWIREHTVLANPVLSARGSLQSISNDLLLTLVDPVQQLASNAEVAGFKTLSWATVEEAVADVEISKEKETAKTRSRSSGP